MTALRAYSLALSMGLLRVPLAPAMPAASNPGCERKMQRAESTSRMRHGALDVRVEVLACPNTAAEPPRPAEVSKAASGGVQGCQGL